MYWVGDTLFYKYVLSRWYVEDQAPVPEPLTDSVQLKHFAREAEVNGNYELATKYYLEVSVECGVISGYCFSKAYKILSNAIILNLINSVKQLIL